MMKTFLDTRIILVAVSAILALTNFLSCEKGSSLARENEQLHEINAEQSDSIETIITKNGNILSEKLAVEADLDLLKERYPEEIKRLQEEHGIELSELRNHTTVAATSSSAGTTKIDTLEVQVGDTVLFYPGVQIREEWFHFDGWWKDGLFDYKRQIFLDLSFATYYEKSGPFWKRKYTPHVSVASADTTMTFTNLRSINIPPPPPQKWFIGPIAGYGITGEGKLSPFLGFGVGYKVF